MKIKAGYRIEVVTWENDADNYNTKSIDGLVADQVHVIVRYLKLHERSQWQGGFGNMYEPDSEEQQVYQQTISQQYADNKEIWDSILGEEPKEEYMFDWIEDFGYELGVRGGEFFTRKVDKITVTYSPVDVVLKDVTDMFVGGDV